jgi:hypothetical protein
MTAALVGWYVELTKLEPAFAAPGESPFDALGRVKPLLVVLIDSASEEAVSDLFAARASRREVGLAIFASADDGESARRWAADKGIPFFKLPVDFEAFGRVLDQAGRVLPERRRVGDRRRAAAVERAIDGTLYLTDDAGRAWYIYDRRASDRRAGQAYRSFVTPNGEEVRALLADDEFSARAPEALIAQLARAE